jgi:hypothetical protein
VIVEKSKIRGGERFYHWVYIGRKFPMGHPKAGKVQLQRNFLKSLKSVPRIRVAYWIKSYSFPAVLSGNGERGTGNG